MFFGADFDPKHSYKMVNKKSGKAVDTGTSIRGNFHASHFGQDQRPLTVYQPTPNYASHNQATRPRIDLYSLDFWLLSGGRRKPVSFLNLSTSVYLK